MAASASDKARKSYSFLQKTLSSGISDSDTTLTPNNVTNIPTDTGVTCIIDRVDSNGDATPSKREIVTGIISGGTITNLTRGQHGTTAQAHSSGAVIEFVMAGNMWNDLIDLILDGHDQNGYHKTLKDSNGNEWLERGETASAVNHPLARNAATGNAPRIEAAGGDTNIDLQLKAKGTGEIVIVDGNGNEMGLFDYVASAVNYPAFVPSATGNQVQLQALGDDTDIGLRLKAKGSGLVTPGRPVAFRATVTGTTGNLAYTSASITATEVFDSGGNFASNTFTAPYNGVYFFNVRIGIDNVTGRLIAGIFVNGSVVDDGFMYAGASNNDPVANAVWIGELTAGQTVTVSAGSESSGQTITGGKFGGFLIGRTD